MLSRPVWAEDAVALWLGRTVATREPARIVYGRRVATSTTPTARSRSSDVCVCMYIGLGACDGFLCGARDAAKRYRNGRLFRSETAHRAQDRLWVAASKSTVGGKARNPCKRSSVTRTRTRAPIKVPAPGAALVFISDSAQQVAGAQESYSTFPTTVVTKTANTVSVDASVLATSNGNNGKSRANRLGGTSQGGKNAAAGTYGVRCAVNGRWGCEGISGAGRWMGDKT
ncbi:hypothetical protein NUW54_g12390 [Trametes sanguinea]|uniref:Uncharacterized protein n=1 Tax=Trametes sanguinea TaxID=158606 RepID=A0ACC1MY12_9APHY|nr:hypothetical protein NUW54_g12390 [Trametes sanguinea]